MADRKTPLDLHQAPPAPAGRPQAGRLAGRLASARGQDYWRSLEELSQADGFEEMLEQEFPRQAGGWLDGLDRRQFLHLMGASLALAGLTGCGGSPREPIMAHVRAPEHIIPGRPLFFATAMPMAGYGSGLLVWSHEGRPTKVEGNPAHPTGARPADSPPHAHFGPSDLFAQASVLGLYDPDRSQAVSNLGNLSSWEAFATELNRRVSTPQGTVNRNLRLRILTETVTSPTLAHQIQSILRDFPNARWHVYEPAGNDNERIGLRHALGRDAAVHYRLDRANVILALDADFLCTGPGHLRYARDFAERRRKRSGASTLAGVGAVGTPLTPLPPALALAVQQRPMNRLYAIEPTPSGTGSTADHRRALRAAQVESFARAVAIRLGVPGVDAQGTGPSHDLTAAWIDALVSDLQANRGSAVVIAGEGQPPIVHALAAAMNMRLGSAGQNGPVVYTAPVEFRPVGRSRPRDEDSEPLASLKELVTALSSTRAEDRVDMLLILGGNPVFTAPADLRFAEAMASVDFRVHLGLYDDETSELCHWHLPEAHYLEAWGDVRAFDGTASIIQPLIAPLYRGRSAHEVLSLLPRAQEGTEEPLQAERSGHEIVRTYWREAGGTVRSLQEQAEAPRTFSGNFESWWRKALHDGVIERTAARGTGFQPVPLLADGWQEAPGRGVGGELRDGLFEIVFRADPTLFDGRFANNGWLQELPRPLSKVTWGNAAYISPVTAVERGFSPESTPERATEQVVIIEHGGRRVELPLYVLPGQAEDSITIHLGGGRTRGGRVGTGVGANVYRLRGSASPWFVTAARVRSAGRLHTLARTQHHH
ncbi:MAG: TAT-variant-translocated molybdopterin oxidoreductase, partial [Gemmataceae bacterium]|nr:TAT-variant-translocated molybdopterin oxidoreductase [Gemmataceae bacterium]